MSRRFISIISIIAVLLLTLTGCSSSPDTQTADTLGIVVLSTYADSDGAEALAENLRAALPALDSETAELSVTPISTGDPNTDPTGMVASTAQMAGLLASGEIDILICDADNARRHGDNGECYLPISELFTEEEQAELGIVPVTVPLLDDDANYTGEESAPCGVDLSGSTALISSLKTGDVAAYVIVNTGDVESAKNVICELLKMK